jgi:hypothetical protein
MYFDTVACETVTPSFSSSPWIRGAPHRGLARLIRRIRSRSSGLIIGRPDRRRLFHAQLRRNAWRCQPTTVSGRTRCSDCRQLVHNLDSSTQKSRSISVSRGRGWRAFQTASCCRSARFSSAKSRCVRTAERSVPRTIHSHLTIDRPIADQPTNGKTTAADEFSGRTASSRV